MPQSHPRTSRCPPYSLQCDLPTQLRKSSDTSQRAFPAHFREPSYSTQETQPLTHLTEPLGILHRALPTHLRILLHTSQCPPCSSPRALTNTSRAQPTAMQSPHYSPHSPHLHTSEGPHIPQKAHHTPQCPHCPSQEFLHAHLKSTPTYLRVSSLHT